MISSHNALAAALAAALFTAVPARAEEAAGGDGSTLIVTAPDLANAAETLAAATPGGTDIIGYEDFADRLPVSLRDVLAYSPGVYLQPRYGQEVRISIRGSGISRGFHMRGLTLLQDGIPINLADDNGDFQELEPIFFDHLEVYRGANALRFGSGTLGGAVNGVTPTGRTAEGLYARLDGGASTRCAASSPGVLPAMSSMPGPGLLPTPARGIAIMSTGGRSDSTEMSALPFRRLRRPAFTSVSTISIRNFRVR